MQYRGKASKKEQAYIKKATRLVYARYSSPVALFGAPLRTLLPEQFMSQDIHD